MADEVVKNVIWRTRIEAEPSPGAKDSADQLRSITAAEKEGEKQAASYTAAQKAAGDATARQAAQYDATAKKMATMFQVIREGTKNVLAYTALDGSLKKVEATFRTNAAGAVELAQDVTDIGRRARETGGDLEALQKQAAKLNTPQFRPDVPTAQTTPTVPQATPLTIPAQVAAQAFAGLPDEVRELGLALIEAGEQGTEAFEQMDTAAKRELATLKELVDQAKVTPEGQDALKKSLTEAQQAGLDTLVGLGAIQEAERGIVEDALRLTNAREQDTEAVDANNAAIGTQLSLLDQYSARVELLQQKRDSLTDPEAVAAANTELRAAVKAYDDLGKAQVRATNTREVDNATKSYSSLRRQLQQAKADLDAIVEANTSPGGILTITPDLIQAAQAAGQLEDRFEDVNATVNAFNPDKKFQVLTGLVQNSLGAFTALQGAMGLIGVESESVEKSLLKVQSALAITQGLQALFGGLRDNLRNLRLQLTASTVASRGLAIAEGQAATGAAVQSGATRGLTGSLAAARAAAAGLWATMLANPFIAAGALVLGFIAGIALMSDGIESAADTVDDFYDTLERRSREAEAKRQFRAARAQIASEIAFLKTKGTEEDKLDKARRDNAIDENQARQALLDTERELTAQEEKRNEILEEGRRVAARQAELGVVGFDRDDDPVQIANEKKLAAERARAEFDFREDLTETQLEAIAKIDEEHAQSIDKRKKQEQDLELVILKGQQNVLAAQKELAAARAAEAKKRADELAKKPLEGSIAFAQQELERLKKIANEVPQNAFPAGVLQAINDAIRKAEADLKTLQQTFIDDSADRLNERQRTVLAFAELDAREQIAAAKAKGDNDETIAALELKLANERIDILLRFERDRLKLMQESGKLTEAELIAHQNRLREIEAGRTPTNAEGGNRVNEARTARLLSELDERQRHVLAIADLDAQAAATRAENEGASAEEVKEIEEKSNRERLLLEIDFQRQRLDILVASGQATEDEVTAARNRLRELEFALELPEPDDMRAKLDRLVHDIIDAADTIAQAGITAWRAWSEAQEASVNAQIDAQERRVEEARELASRGNAEMLEEEKKRLNELSKERRRIAEQNAAIAQTEAAAEAVVAIARAAAEGGGWLSAVTIAATLAALAAGIVSARQTVSDSGASFRKGGEVDWSNLGGYTGNGNPDAESTALGAKPYKYHKREFMMDETTTAIGNNLAWFRKIQGGRVNMDHLINPRAFVQINPGGMSDKQVNKIVRAIEEKPTPNFTLDEQGLTRTITTRNARAKRLHRIR